MKRLTLIGSILLLLSGFFPWVSLDVFGGAPVTFSPWSVAERFIDQATHRRTPNMPLVAWAFFASFVIAALLAMSTLLGTETRFGVLLAGALPFMILVWAGEAALSEIDRSGLPVADMFEITSDLDLTRSGFDAIVRIIAQTAQVGFYLHYASAIALLVAATMRRPSEDGK